MREVQGAQVTTTDELRTELDATQEGVAAADKGAVEMCRQLQNELDDFRRHDGDDHDERVTPVRRAKEK